MDGLRLIVIVTALLAAPGAAEDSPLGLADLEAYRVALAAEPNRSAPEVRFRDLWERPEAYAGRPVRVEGRVARVFRQPRVGEFPPMAETWIVSAAGDPSVLVFPLPEGRPAPEVGAPVRFAGTFLRRLRYQGGDAARVAPLIVGPEPPSAMAGASTGATSWSTLDWIMGLGAASMVAMVLARRHLDRPIPRPPIGPPPQFVDGGIGPAAEAPDEEGSGHDQPR